MALIGYSILLDYPFTNSSLLRLRIRTAVMMRLYVVVNTKEEAREIVDSQLLVQEGSCNEVGHLRNVNTDPHLENVYLLWKLSSALPNQAVEDRSMSRPDPPPKVVGRGPARLFVSSSRVVGGTWRQALDPMRLDDAKSYFGVKVVRDQRMKE